MTLRILHKSCDEFRKLHLEYSSLRGWGPIVEHQLMAIESCFSFAFPSSVMPYLDFLSNNGIQSNPFSMFQRVKQAVVVCPNPSPLFIDFIQAGLEKIGDSYLRYLESNPKLFCFDYEKVSAKLHTAMVVMIEQHFAMAQSPSTFGDALQAEAGAIAVDRLLNAILGTEVGIVFSYDSFTIDTIGSHSLIQKLLESGVRVECWMAALQSHWQNYLGSTCGYSNDLKEAKLQALMRLDALLTGSDGPNQSK